MIRCNKCTMIFEDEEELIVVEEDGEFFKACPNCLTDEYLMDEE